VHLGGRGRSSRLDLSRRLDAKKNYMLIAGPLNFTSRAAFIIYLEKNKFSTCRVWLDDSHLVQEDTPRKVPAYTFILAARNLRRSRSGVRTQKFYRELSDVSRDHLANIPCVCFVVGHEGPA